MKKRTVIKAVCVIGLAAYVLWYTVNRPAEYPQESVPNQETRQEVTVDRQPAPVDALSFLIDRIHTPASETVITPATTAELRTWFTEADIQQSVPRVFVDRLPADFAEQGDKDLFAKVIAALILRENEKALKDRAALLMLKNKLEKGESWTEKETDFFNELVEKYDSKARRVATAQIADMMLKIDVIPPMTAVIQAAEATDWGRENMTSPYEQTGWLDSKTYTRVPFDSLIRATESYAREMNGMPPLEGWRYSRQYLRGQEYTDSGTRILRWLGEYKMEDMQYTEKLQQRVQELGYEIPDTLRFIKKTDFGRGEVRLNGYTFSVEVAQTDLQKRQGLMFRETLPEGSGMIFMNLTDVPVSVWMKNTFVPLDIVFFDREQTIVKMLPGMIPLSETPHSSEEAVRGFIEFPAGTIQKYHLNVGDRFDLTHFSSSESGLRT